MKRRLMALFVVATLALAACSSSDDPKPDPKPAALKLPEPGQCLAKEKKDLDDIAPDLSSVVPCSAPHIFEIVDVFDVPAQFLKSTGGRDGRLAERTDLLKVAGTSRMRADFVEWATRRCNEAKLQPSRLSELRLHGKSAADSRVGFVFGGAQSWINGSPPTLWARGQTSVICSVRFTKHIERSGNFDARPVISKDDRPVWQRFRSDGFPLDRRQCLDYDDNDWRLLVTCDKPHYGEFLFTYDAGRVFGKAFVKTVDPYEPTDKQWDTLGEPCFDALYTLFGEDFDEDLSAVAEIGDLGWGQSDDDTDLVECIAIPYDSDTLNLPGGTLFDESTHIDFVPIIKPTDA